MRSTSLKKVAHLNLSNSPLKYWLCVYLTSVSGVFKNALPLPLNLLGRRAQYETVILHQKNPENFTIAIHLFSI